jgi:hypothetical protein
MTKEQCQEKIDILESDINYIDSIRECFFKSNKPVFDGMKNSLNQLSEIKSYFETLLKVYDIQDESNNISPSARISG